MLSFVLQRLDGRQSEIAAAMGVSESTVSRFKNEELQKLCRVLAHGGMKITPAEFKCYDPKQIDALFTLAKGQFDRAENVDDVLLWED